MRITNYSGRGKERSGMNLKEQEEVLLADSGRIPFLFLLSFGLLHEISFLIDTFPNGELGSFTLKQ